MKTTTEGIFKAGNCIISHTNEESKGKNMTAAAYARYSTSLQTETSIAAQLKGISDYCAAHKLTIVETYIDEARSGTNTDREGFQRLLSDAASHKFAAVVVYDVSRGSRDVGDWFSFRRLMQQYGIDVHSVTNTLGNPDDPDSYLMELLTVGIGQHQVLQSRQKSIAGKRISAERGLFCGGLAPFGYDIVDRHYAINLLEAAFVRRIYEMYANGSSYGDIIAMLNTAHMHGRRGQLFSPTSLHDILTNERYTGVFLWFVREERHMKKHVGRVNPDPVRIDGIIPRIVSDELFAAVQSRIRANTHNRTNKSRPDRTYYLSGLVYCAKCGSAIMGYTNTSKGYEYKRYTCIRKRKYKTCDLKNINGDALEQAAIRIIREKILNDSTIEQLADHVLAELQQDDARPQLESELKDVTARYQNLCDACEKGAPYEDLADRMRTLKARQKDLTIQLAEFSSNDLPSRESIIEVLRADTQKLTEDPESINALIHKYVYKVLIDDTTVEFQLRPLANINKNRDNGNRYHGELLRYVLPRGDVNVA